MQKKSYRNPNRTTRKPYLTKPTTRSLFPLKIRVIIIYKKLRTTTTTTTKQRKKHSEVYSRYGSLFFGVQRGPSFLVFHNLRLSHSLLYHILLLQTKTHNNKKSNNYLLIIILIKWYRTSAMPHSPRTIT